MFDTNEREKQYRFATGMTADQEAAIRSGDAYRLPTSRFNADGSSNNVSDEQRMDGWQATGPQRWRSWTPSAKTSPLEERQHAADAESVYQDIGTTEGVRKKDGDYAGLLAKQGKGLYDNEDGGTFNQETGEHKPSPLGQAKAQKESALRAAGTTDARQTTPRDAEARRDLKEQRVPLTTQINDPARPRRRGRSSRQTAKAEQKLSSLRLRLRSWAPMRSRDDLAPAAPRRLKFNPVTGKLE